MQQTRAEKTIHNYKLVLTMLGALSLLYCIKETAQAPIDLRWIVIACFVPILSQIAASRVPGAKTVITISDTFIFLTVLLCGVEAGVIVAAIATASDSLRYAKRVLTVTTNIGVMCFSLLLSCTLVNILLGDPRSLAHHQDTFFYYVLSITLLAAVQGIINSLVLMPIVTLQSQKDIFSAWRENYSWILVTQISGIVIASFTSNLVYFYGFKAAVLALPMLYICHLTVRPYLKNIEATQRHLAELQESEDKFRSAFDHAAVGIALVNSMGKILQVNHSLISLTGYSEAELLNLHFQAITHPEDLGKALIQFHQLLDGQFSTFQMEKRYLHKQGHPIWVQWSVSQFRESKSKEERLIFQIQDITDRKHAEEQLIRNAFYDILTALPNRALFIDHLKMALERAKRSPERVFAILFLDLDRFKIVNDSLGHLIGDRLLIEFAQRLQACLRPGDVVARLGGDEFTILLEGLNNASEVKDVADRIHKELLKPFTLDGHEFFTTTSIGIAYGEANYDQPEDILRDADTAMYKAKSIGSSSYEVFDRKMHSEAVSRLQMETDLRRALERQELFLLYQPIVSLTSGRVCGFEALIRWQHPERGLISPAVFIPIAEETGLIIPIGQWVLKEACRQMAYWVHQVPEILPLQMSVNISSKQFAHASLLSSVQDALKETRLPANCLKLEITESVVMENSNNAIDLLKQIKSLGIALSIDDFGTGYSSLGYLHRFPLDTLKIDRSFVMQMLDNNENTEIVKTILSLAQNLHMDVIAEGVEKQEHVLRLRALGCEYAQGYYFSRPLDKIAATHLIENNKNWRSFTQFADLLINSETSENLEATLVM